MAQFEDWRPDAGEIEQNKTRQEALWPPELSAARSSLNRISARAPSNATHYEIAPTRRLPFILACPP